KKYPPLLTCGLGVRQDIGYSRGICRSRHLLSWLIAPWTRSSKEKRTSFTVFRTSSRNSNAPSGIDPAQSIDSAIEDLNRAIPMLRVDFFGCGSRCKGKATTTRAETTKFLDHSEAEI